MAFFVNRYFSIPRRPFPGLTKDCHERLSSFGGITVESVKDEFQHFKGGSVKLEKNREKGIATITLCHSEKRNCLSGSMMCQLSEIVSDLEHWSNGRAVLLRSDDQDFFCSGADLTSTVIHINSPEGGFKLATLMHDTVSRLANLPLISVCLVQGRAIGGGAELSLSTDFRAFAPSGRLNFVQARLGVLPGWAGGSKLVSLVGRNRALEILLTCRSIKSNEAYHLGLCDKILETGSVEETEHWIQSLIQHDPKVSSLVKSLCDRVGTVAYDEGLEQEKLLFASVWGGEANKRALAARLKHK